MSLQFHPNPGALLVCDFTGFIEPEMVKRRLVVVVSPRFRARHGLCTVVPLSTTDPRPVCPYHHRLCIDPAPPKPWGPDCWAKCDMVAAVSFARLDMIKLGKDKAGKRQYAKLSVSSDDLNAIRRCVIHAVGAAG